MKYLIFSLPYITLVYFIPSIDYLRRYTVADSQFNVFDILTQEPFIIIELYIFDLISGTSAVTVTRIINIILCIYWILKLSKMDGVNLIGNTIVIYNPISFFLIFNINPQLLATLAIYQVARDKGKTGYISFLAPSFHMLGLLAIAIKLIKRLNIIIWAFPALMLALYFISPDTTFYILQPAFNFIYSKLTAYSEYEVNRLHFIVSVSIFTASTLVLMLRQKGSRLFIALYILISLLSVLALDSKFASRLLFSIEFILIYEIVRKVRFKPK